MDDLISRQDAIDKVSEYASVWMSYTDGMSKEEIAQEALNSAKDTMIRIISELPSVQPFEDIHREKEQAYYCGYEDGAKAARSALRRKKMKGAEDECINRIADAVVQKLREVEDAGRNE